MDDKTKADEAALIAELTHMLASGKDGVEAGATTTEFWLVALAVAIDILGPTYGFLQGIDPNEQGLIALALAVGYAGLRSWRKRGGPAKLVADLLKALAQARGQAPEAPATPPAPPAAALEAPPAA